MKFKKIYIHIGWPKTGTSTIQYGLAENRDSLLEQESMLYPASLDFVQHTALVSLLSDKPQAIGLNARVRKTSNLDVIRNQDRILEKKLHQELEATKADFLIFSAEAFSSFLRTKPEVERLAKWLSIYSENIEIIAFVREPFSWMSSLGQQRLNAGALLKDILDSPTLPQYKNVLQTWLSVFNKDAIKVIKMEDFKIHQHGLWGIFCDTIGLQKSWYENRSIPDLNSSYSLEATYIANAINKIEPFKMANGKLNAKRFAGDLNKLKIIKGRKFLIPADLLVKHQSTIQQDLDWLESEYGITYKNIQTNDFHSQQSMNIESHQLTLEEPALLSLAELLVNLSVENRTLREQLRKAKNKLND